MATNYFDKFDAAAPVPRMDQPIGPAGVTALMPRPSTPAPPAANFFDKFDGSAPAAEPEQSSAIPAFLRRALASTVPATGAFAAGETGAGIGAAGGTAIGGPIGGVAGGLIGAVGGALAGGAAVQKGQDFLLDKVPFLRHILGQDQQQVQQDEQQHPIASFAGEVAPQLLTLRPGAAPILARAASAGIGGGLEVGQEYAQGQPLNPLRIAGQAGVNALLGARTGLGERLAAPGEAIAARFGAATPHTAPTRPLADPLVDAPLDGAPAVSPDIAASLAAVGADPASFSPDRLAAMAARANAARANPAPNLSTGMPAGIGSKRLARLIDTSAPVDRTVPPDVTMIAAPEGTVRSDDAGAQAGLDRKRAADASVLTEAQRHVADNPLVSSILDSNLSPQAKVATVWDQIQKTLSQPSATDAPAPPRVDPYTAPTADVARAPTAQTYMDRVRAKESGGNDNAQSATSSAGGRYQFTDATWLQNFKEAFPNSGQSDAAIIAQKGNGQLQDTLMRHLTDGNAKAITDAGFDASMGNLRLAHFLGRAGALRALRADPDTPIVNLVGAEAVRANERALGNKTVGQVIADAHAQMGERPSTPSALYRMAAPPAEQIDGQYSGRSAPIGGADISMGDAENLDATTSPTNRERATGVDQEAPLRPVADEPGAQPRRQLPAPAREEPIASEPQARVEPPIQNTPRAQAEPGGEVMPAATSGRESGQGARSPVAASVEPAREGAAPAPDGAAGSIPAAAPPEALQQQPRPQRIQQQQQQARGPRMPEDVLTFLARKGGLRDDGGHNLRKSGREMGQFAPGGGHVFRKNGMSIDEAGEALHEAGWFPGQSDWTESDVLELLHRAEFEPQYHPDDAAAAHDIRASAENDRWEQGARDELASVADEHDEPQPRDEAVQHMLGLMGSGASAHEAYRAHHDMDYQAALDELDSAPREEPYDGAVEGRNRAGTEADRGPDDTGEHPGATGTGPARGREDGQQDAFGNQPGDERAALERRGEGRQRGSVEQKPPGSDGGLFDPEGGKDCTLFSRARDEGLGRDRPATRPLSDDLRALASARENTHARRLAARLADLVGDAEVEHGEDLGPDVRGAARLDADGRASASVAHAGDHEALLHEAVHVATLTRYGELGPHAPEVDALERLRARATKAFARRGDDPSGQIAHALTSPDEFLAGGLTSPRVQQFLQRHNAAGLWGRFVDGVRGVLGVEPRYGSLLDRVLQHGARLIDQMGPPASRTAKNTTLLSRGRPVDPDHPDESGWKSMARLVFEPDLLNSDGPALTQAVRETFGDPRKALAGAVDRLKRFGEVAAYSADSALRSMSGRFNAPTIAKLADVFHAEAGKDGAVGRTYAEAITRQTTRFGNDLHSALKPHLEDDAAMGRIRDLLATPTASVRATAAERTAAGKVRDLLAEVLDYRRDAGEAIGEVRDGYFPRIPRFDKVAKAPERFRAAAEKTYAQAGAPDPKGAAEAWLQNALDGNQGISDGLGFAGGGKPNSTKVREFGKYADENLREFYETNPLRALSDYVGGSVRAAERSRRFGAVGREGSPERAAWQAEHGDATRWDVMRDQIKAELRAHGGDASGVMERLDGIRQTNLGMSTPGQVKAGAAVSVVHAWNQLSTLAQSTFASLPELAMGFVRAGPRYGFTHLSTTFDEFQRNVRRLPPSDARRYAEAAGAVGSDTALDLLRARADDPTQNTGVQRLLHSFYRKNGLEQWTDAGRTAAVRTGQRFIDALAHDMESADARTRTRAGGYLRELGVKDPDGFGRQVRAGAPTPEGLRSDTGFAGDYATALLRFADQTVLMPNRAVKPTWASHPLGSLLFALQSYNYAFKKNVLDRVGREALAGIKERDPSKLAPAAGLVMLTGVTALTTGLRHMIYGSATGNNDETPMQYALETGDRAGLFGAASPLLNAFQGLRYKRSVGQVLQGAVIGRAAEAADAVGGLAVGNNADTNTAERKAAGAVYDMAIRPSIDAIGAGVLRGGLGTAAIMGTGGRSGGLAAPDKEAFVSRVAGPKPEPVD